MAERIRRLVWLSVNCSYSHSSLALPMLHSVCREIPGWEWKRVEIISAEDSASAASMILEEPCDLLCAHLYLFNREKVLDILKRVHALSPETRIAAGGPECSPEDAPELLKKEPYLSVIFTGEAEETFPVFLKNFAEWKDRKRVLPESGRGIFRDWENSDFPVNDPFFRTDKPFVQIETSRGCPMACSYCTSSGISQRYRSSDQVEKELMLLREKGVKEIRVLDRTFNLPQERGAALLRLFGKFPEMRFHMEIHPQFLGEELRECFRNALPGQFHVEAGMQSLDPAVQQAIGRRSDVERALDGIRFLVSCKGFETHTDLLAGLPAQTFRSLRNDLILLMETGPAEIQLEVLKILPGTPVGNVRKEYGIIDSPAPPYDVMRTSAMTAEEILAARQYSRILDLFYNHEALHPVMLAACRERKECFLVLADEIMKEKTDLNILRDLKKRFLRLERFLREHDLAGAEVELSCQWLLSGYPVTEGPGASAEILRMLPEKMTLLSGNDDCRTQRETRFWQIRKNGKYMIFAWNRACSQHKPCAVWEYSK